MFRALWKPLSQHFNGMRGVRLQKGLQLFPEITSKFFSKASITKFNWADENKKSKWYGTDQEYVLLSADQEGPEAVAVGSLCYALLKSLIHGGAKSDSSGSEMQ